MEQCVMALCRVGFHSPQIQTALFLHTVKSSVPCVDTLLWFEKCIFCKAFSHCERPLALSLDVFYPLFLPSFTPLTSFSSSSLPPLLLHHSFSYLLSSFLSIPDVSVINRFKKGFSVSTVLYFLSGKLVPVSEAGNGPSPVWVCFGDSGEHCCC